MPDDGPSGFRRGDFDPDYFRETRPGWQGVDDATCLEAWLTDASTAGPGCGRDHLISLRLDLADYPAAFPWALYIRWRPEAGANRWAALEHFCHVGFKDGVQLPFDPEARSFLVSLARGYANRDDFLAIQAFELAAVLQPLSQDEQQHLGDSYIRLKLYQRARQVYLTLLRSGGGSDWTLRNCIKSSLYLCDWATAADVLVETQPVWGQQVAWVAATFELIERAFAWGLERAQGKYAAGRMEQGDEDIAALVASSEALLLRLGVIVRVQGGAKHVLVVANCDDAVSYAHRAEAKSALFAHLSAPWRLMPMTELENAPDALSGASALIFFNAPAELLPLRALLSARLAKIPVIYEVDAPVFDPAVYPPPLAAFDGLITPQIHQGMRLRAALNRELARRCDYGLAVSDRVASRLASLVRQGQGRTLVKLCNPDPFVFPIATPLPARFLFLRAPRFLALVDEPGALGAALLRAMGADAELGLVTSGYVHLDAGFNAFDARLVDLGASAEPSTYRAAIAASCLTIAPRCLEDDDGMSELIWLEAAELGKATLLDAGVAADLGLRGGETCVTADERGWARALDQALADPATLQRIGRQARDHARASRGIADVAAQVLDVLRMAQTEALAL